MLKSLRLLPLLLLGATPISVAMATIPPAVVPPDAVTVRAIDALLKAAYPADGPGASLVVTRFGKPLYSGARGMADIKAGRAIRVGDPFPLASITKTLTAAMIVKLADQGMLSLEDRVSTHVPGFGGPAGEATIRQLLNHNSGIADFSKVPGFISANRAKSFTTSALIDVMAKLPPTAKPGETWEYNNGGYALLGAVIEKVTGKRWTEAMEAALFAPLGLKSFSATRVPPRLVRPYGGPDASAESFDPTEISIAGAAGQMNGNAPDLARFLNALHRGQVVSPASYRQMTARAPMNDGKTMPYGFGFRLGRLLDSPTYYQGGSLLGGRTEALYLPEHQLLVVALVNSDEPQSHPREFALRVAATALGTPLPLFAKTELLLDKVRPALGSYQGSEGPERKLFERDGKLWLALGNSPARQAFAAGGDLYFFGADELSWFELKTVGGKRHLVFHTPEDKRAHDAVLAAPVTEAVVAEPAFAGRYKPEAGTEFLIAIGKDSMMTVSSGGKDIGPLRAIEGGQYAIDGTPMRLQFVRKDGRVSGIKLYRGARTMNAVKID